MHQANLKGQLPLRKVFSFKSLRVQKKKKKKKRKETYDLHPFQTLMDYRTVRPALWCRPTHTECRDGIMFLGLGLRVGVPGRDFVHRFAELDLAEQEQAGAAAHAGLAVAGRLARDVGEVDAFPEGVAVDGCFRWSDAEALGEYTAKVCGAGTVPGGAFVFSGFRPKMGSKRFKSRTIADACPTS